MNKAALRKEIRASLRQLPPDEKQRQAYAAAAQVLRCEAFLRAHTLMLYRATSSEIDTMPLRIAAEAAGKKVAYPVCIDERTMLAAVPDSPDAWQRGKYGIWAPLPERSEIITPEQIDLVIVPGVAFDRRCFRIGQGGGYYDRFLSTTHAYRIGYAFDLQILPSLPTEAHDLPMNRVISAHQMFTRHR